MADILILQYEGESPTDEQVRHELGLPPGTDTYTYIVATLAQERRRKGLAPAHQVSPDDERHLVFHKAIRYFLKKVGRSVLTRAEERVLIQRAIQLVATDPATERVLRHDVFAWRDGLMHLAEEGLDLTTGISPDIEDRLVGPGVGQVLQDLQRAFRDLLVGHDRRPFEETAFSYIQAEYQPTPLVIMEGFTFFTPLQRAFIDVCRGRGARLAFVYPYSAAQARGFEVMQDTYEPILPSATIRRLPAPMRAATDTNLATLRSQLFADTPAAGGGPSGDDGSVRVLGFNHRHHEVAACIQAIGEMLQRGTDPGKIAVVMRDAGAFQALLQEEAELQDLSVTLGIPPRLLLLTPIGRFALTLYQVWKDNALQMTADQLEEILASGWLGAHVQATIDAFAAVKAQVFARCETRAEWQASLDRIHELRENLPAASRLPVATVDDDTLDLWRGALQQVEDLCRRLFAAGQRSIGEHIKLLLDELSRLASADLLEAERAVVERIREVLLQLSEESSVPIDPGEFGEVLNSLVREYRRADSDDEIPDEPGKIWITTPEGIDGYEKPIVFYLGVDNHRVPRAYTEPWPLQDGDVSGHTRRERYLFLAVLRATTRRLRLSYARLDQEGTYRASQYLDEASGLLPAPAISTEPAPALRIPALAESPEDPLLLRARRGTYGLAEIAHFALCPYRYKLERLDASARRYHDGFQMKFLAQGRWLDLLLTNISQQGHSTTGPAEVLAMLRAAKDATEPRVRADFPGLGEPDWYTLSRYVQRDLEYESRRAGTYPFSVTSAPRLEVVVPDGQRAIRIDVQLRHAIKKGLYLYPYLTDVLREEWLLPSAGDPQDSPAEQDRDGLRLFTSQYHAVQWWSQAVTKAFYHRVTQGQHTSFAREQPAAYEHLQADIAERLPMIEAGYYPKHPGNHCKLCPARAECLGLEG
jgi:hypothetical protein